VAFDIDNTDVPDLFIQPEYSYSDYKIPEGNASALNNMLAAGANYDTIANWDDFYWSGPHTSLAEASTSGSGLNVSYLLRGASNYEAPHRIHAITIYYGLRGLKI